MSSIIFQGLFFFIVLLLLAVPLGWYIREIMQGNILRYVSFLKLIERGFYKVIGSVS